VWGCIVVPQNETEDREDNRKELECGRGYEHGRERRKKEKTQKPYKNDDGSAWENDETLQYETDCCEDNCKYSELRKRR